MRAIIVAGVVLLAACSGTTAQFRPGKGATGYGPAKDAYRIKEPKDGCDELGYVVQAERIEDIAAVAAKNGGTHFMVLDDFGSTSVETDTTGVVTRYGAVSAHSSSQTVQSHAFTARVYHCM